jgi:iron compound ABC transporter, permease protein
MLGAIIAGMGLSVAGVILQGVMNNALASPNTIGVNSGAGFFVMLAMMLFPHSVYATSIASFVGALLTTLAIYALAYMADSSRTTIILAGITVSSFLNAGINTIKLINTDITLNITSFLMGTLSGLTFNKIALPAIGIIAAVLVSFILAKPLNILSLGDDYARSLGLNVPLTRFFLLVLSSIMAGLVVSFAGLLSFIGLIVPHICRTLFGSDARYLLPTSALLGASFVLICDIIGRLIAAPYELPAGIIMAFIGGPFFMYLLLKKKGGRRINA